MTFLGTPFTSFFVFVISTLSRKRRVRCVPENDASLCNVGRSLLGGLHRDKAILMTYSSTTDVLNGIFQGGLDRPAGASVNIGIQYYYLKCWSLVLHFLQFSCKRATLDASQKPPSFSSVTSFNPFCRTRTIACCLSTIDLSPFPHP